MDLLSQGSAWADAQSRISGLRAQKNPPPGRVIIFDDFYNIAWSLFLSTNFFRVGQNSEKYAENASELEESALFSMFQTLFYRVLFIGAILSP